MSRQDAVVRVVEVVATKVESQETGAKEDSEHLIRLRVRKLGLALECTDGILREAEALLLHDEFDKFKWVRDINAFSRYENGKTKPPLAPVKLLKVLDRHPTCSMRSIWRRSKMALGSTVAHSHRDLGSQIWFVVQLGPVPPAISARLLIERVCKLPSPNFLGRRRHRVAGLDSLSPET